MCCIAEKPYRVVRTMGGKLYGWKNRVVCFATVEEARVEFERRVPGTLSVRMDEALNAATWTKNGRWKLLRQR